MEIYSDPEKLILCPYNKAHEIRASRMNTHLQKCRKNYPNSAYVQCDFNATHLLPQPELQYHHEICMDRQKFEQQLFFTADDIVKEKNNRPHQTVQVPNEECWDDDDQPTYDPKVYCERAPVLRQLKVEPAAKRKDFRIEERKRHQQLEERVERVPVCSRKPAPVKLPFLATGQTLEEAQPDSVKLLESRIRIPQMPKVPQRPAPKEGGSSQ